jgi:hypothetical protein
MQLLILKILFVGNSLTYYNDLPSLVSQIAKEDGVEISYKTIALPNFSIDDHLAGESIPSAFSKDKFDFLIAQQGPSSLPEAQEMLKASAIKLSKICASHKTRLALYMVWPEMSRGFAREDVIVSYTNAAKASNALLCPAGVAWKKAMSLPLYGPDGFHPGIHGSVLAALTIYASIAQKKDLNFLTKSKWPEISDEQLEIMKEAAITSL